MAHTRHEAAAVPGTDQPLSVQEDAAFVAALRAGRRDAFERLVADYQTPLYSLALRIVQNREDARDVVQEVFIKAFRALPATHGRLHLRAWLHRITVNASYDHLRACKRRPLPVEDEELERPSTVDETEQADLVRMFTQTLRSLPPRQQLALLLKDVHGLPHVEIAEALGISRGSAEVLLFRARSGFRRRFATLSDLAPSGTRCDLAERQAARAVGGGLPPIRRRQLLEHARTCPDCRRTVEGIGGAALGLAVAFPLVAMSPAAAAALSATVAAGTAAGVAGSAACATGLAGVAAAAGGTAASCTTAGAAMSSAAAGSLATGGGAIAGGVAAKLGALAGMKTAAVVASACVVTAGGVAGVEVGMHHDAGRTTATAPASMIVAAPTSKVGGPEIADPAAAPPTASPASRPSSAVPASPSAPARPADTPSPSPSTSVVVSAVVASSPATLDAIVRDAADGTLDGDWSKADVAAALAGLSPMDLQYSDVDDVLAAYLAGSAGSESDEGSEDMPAAAEDETGLEDPVPPVITPSATAQTVGVE